MNTCTIKPNSCFNNVCEDETSGKIVSCANTLTQCSINQFDFNAFFCTEAGTETRTCFYKEDIEFCTKSAVLVFMSIGFSVLCFILAISFICELVCCCICLKRKQIIAMR